MEEEKYGNLHRYIRIIAKKRFLGKIIVKVNGTTVGMIQSHGELFCPITEDINSVITEQINLGNFHNLTLSSNILHVDCKGNEVTEVILKTPFIYYINMIFIIVFLGLIIYLDTIKNYKYWFIFFVFIFIEVIYFWVPASTMKLFYQGPGQSYEDYKNTFNAD